MSHVGAAPLMPFQVIITFTIGSDKRPQIINVADYALTHNIKLVIVTPKKQFLVNHPNEAGRFSLVCRPDAQTSSYRIERRENEKDSID
jgi:hypothetical protein